VATPIKKLPSGNRIARRVGEQANRLRFTLWGGFLGLLTLVMVWFALSAGDDQSYSVRSNLGGETAGDRSKHAYAYQGLARLLRAEGLGGQSIYGNSPLGSVGLRVLLEPQMVSADQDARRAFRDFLTQSKTPVLVVSALRTSTSRTLRLDKNGHLLKPLPKPRSGLGNRLNDDLGLERRIAQLDGPVQGRLLGSSVAIDDMVYFTQLWTGAKTWDIDGKTLIFRQQLKGTDVYFLADPDLLNNAGLARAENAGFVLSWLEQIKGPGNVVFDNRDIRIGGSTGFSFVGRLFEWPLGIVTGSVLSLALVLFWLSFGRFGPMLRETRHLEAGKETALEAAVSLLAGSGNNREILRRYLEGQTRQLAARLGGPKTGDSARLQAWLDAIAKRRGVDPALRLGPVATLLEADTMTLSENQAAHAAHTIHAFRRALIHDT
jgi:hypothetical protein